MVTCFVCVEKKRKRKEKERKINIRSGRNTITGSEGGGMSELNESVDELGKELSKKGRNVIEARRASLERVGTIWESEMSITNMMFYLHNS